jgi:hypothetical protein
MVDMDIKTDETPSFIVKTFASHFPDASTTFLDNVFEKIQDLFEGRYPGYQQSDTAYHDFIHTCRAAVAVTRILDGHLKSGKTPAVGWREFELVIAATLLHDSGFIKQSDDGPGTGAKYTLTHVKRSEEFAATFLPEFGVTADEIRLVQLIIDCTGVAVNVEYLPFNDDQERFLGWVLGTGDILGQMAAPDYPESLYGLYQEFSEAAAYSNANGSWIEDYASAEDLMKKTRNFYEGYVQWMLQTQWGGVHEALLHHFGNGKNLYIERVEANIEDIEQRVHAAKI